MRTENDAIYVEEENKKQKGENKKEKMRMKKMEK